MFSWLDPEDFGKLQDPEYRKKRGLAIQGEVVSPSQPSLSAPRAPDYTPLFRELTNAVGQLADRVEALEQSPVLGLPGHMVIRQLRASNASINADSLD